MATTTTAAAAELTSRIVLHACSQVNCMFRCDQQVVERASEREASDKQTCSSLKLGGHLFAFLKQKQPARRRERARERERAVGKVTPLVR